MPTAVLPLPAFAPLPSSAPLPRPAHRVVWGLALWLAGPANLPLWQRLWVLAESPGHRLAFLGSLGLAVLALTAGLLFLLALPRLFRPMASLLVLIAAASSHFMWQYGVVIDTSMLVNVSHTDAREVRDLLSWPLALSLLLLAGPPLWWLWRQPVATATWGRQLLRNLLGAVAALGLAVAAVLLGYQNLAGLMRNHKDLRYMINPLNTVYAAGWMVTERSARLGRTLAPLGEDATLGASYQGQARPPLLVLVVGETARAQNWGLGGYARNTTPVLARWQARQGLVNFGEASSCGTNTQVSVPCMFSHLGRGQGGERPPAHENLLDVLQRAGLAVLWVDNQSGCKGVCDRVPSVDVRSEPVPGLCRDGVCFDGRMLLGLDQRIEALDPARRARGVVVVMHQMGSHGPAYHERSPADLKPYLPECRDAALSNCSPQEVVNAYDNSIAYTDRFLGQTLAWLHRQAAAGRYDTGLLYVSDHGESLGENGLYLHGLPYALAPSQQTHVPMVGWLSAGLQRRSGVDTACLRERAAKPVSHDHLFHSVLGVMDVQTGVRDRSLDLFLPCAGVSVSRPQAG